MYFPPLKIKIKGELKINCHYLQFPVKTLQKIAEENIGIWKKPRKTVVMNFARNERKSLSIIGKAVGVILVTI